MVTMSRITILVYSVNQRVIIDKQKEKKLYKPNPLRIRYNRDYAFGFSEAYVFGGRIRQST